MPALVDRRLPFRRNRRTSVSRLALPTIDDIESPRPMRSTLFLLLFGVLRLAAFAEEYPEFNFAIDAPKGWKIEKPSKRVIFRAANADGTTNLVVAAGPVTMFERVTATKDSRGGLRSAMTPQGWTFSDEEEAKIGQMPFITFTGSNPNGQTRLSTVAGREISYI